MAYGKDIQARCELLYVETGVSIEDLHQIFKITKSTLQRWKQKGDWDERKKVHTLSPIRLAQKFRDQIGLIIKAAEDEERVLNSKETDMIAKLQKAAYNIAPNATIMSIGMDVIRDFMIYIKEQNPELSAQMVGLSQDFLRTLYKPKSGI